MNVAIIGLGKVAELHVEALRQLEPHAFVGGWSRSADKAEAFCTRFGGTAYATVEALLGDEHVNAVLVATGSDSHFDYAKRALVAGKHVLLEKPLSPSLRRSKSLPKSPRPEIASACLLITTSMQKACGG